MSEAIVKGVAEAISRVKTDLENEIVSVKRSVKNDIQALIARDWSSDMVKDYREQRSYKPGDLVRYKGGVWQAWTDTDDAPHVKESGWVCLHNGVADIRFEAPDMKQRRLTLEMSDGTARDFEWTDPVLEYKGVWQEGETYGFNDVVICGGDSYISLDYDNNTQPATDGTKWSMLVQRGKTGKPGTIGPQGEKGEKGDAGKDADPLTTARIIMREMTAALKEKINAE